MVTNVVEKGAKETEGMDGAKKITHYVPTGQAGQGRCGLLNVKV